MRVRSGRVDHDEQRDGNKNWAGGNVGVGFRVPGAGDALVGKRFAVVVSVRRAKRD